MKKCVVKSIKKSVKDNNFYMFVECEGITVNGFAIPERKCVYMGDKDPSKAFKIGSSIELPESSFL